jgi:predicted ester cyclase
MTSADLSDVYQRYIACLTMCTTATGASGYRKMLERDFCEIAAPHLDIQLLMSDPPSGLRSPA